MGSSARHRAESYAMRFKGPDIICFTRNTQQYSIQALSNNARVYPTSSRLALLWGWDAIKIAVRLTRPDVISVQDPFETGFLGWVLSVLRRSSLHVQVHTDFLAPSFSKGIVNRIRRLVAGFVLRRADRIRVVSSRIKTGIENRYAPRAPISILPIFVDLDRFKHASAGAIAGRFSEFDVKFLVVARLEPEKNVALAIESFAAKAPQSACLIIVGGGSERTYLEQLAAKQGIVKRVFFEGAQGSAPYFALADLVLVPSLYEGYCQVIIEALAAGKPVLSTDAGVAKEAGAIVTSPERFADVLQEWIANGPRTGVLREYPYHSFDEYVDAYCADVSATARK